MNNQVKQENPHKPLFNSILSILFILVLIFITSKSPFAGFIIILLFAITIMAYIQGDDPEKYVTVSSIK